jgi:hypothetical protein
VTGPAAHATESTAVSPAETSAAPAAAELKIPSRMAGLPRDKHHRVVPWFVAWIDGAPDFRIIRDDGIREALRDHTCWLCGQPLGRYVAFVIGPMCAVNRVTAEPGSHLDCALYAAKACPFLATPSMKRREIEDWTAPAGHGVKRNPGCALVWVTRVWSLFPDYTGNYLLHLGAPESVHWFAHGRDATRAEVLASIDSGMPILQEACDLDEDPDESRRVLAEQYQAAMQLIPAEVSST